MITSVEDLLRNEMTRSIVEVVEAEVGERVVETLDTVVQLNETESSGELSALLRAAGKGQDGTVTLDDIYTLVAGEGALRIPEVSLLMQQVPLLKGDQIQQTKLERWFASPKRPLRPSASPRHLFYIPCAPLQVVARHRAVARPAAARGRDCARRRRVEPRPARRPAATERVQPPLQPGRWSRRGDDDLRGELDNPNPNPNPNPDLDPDPNPYPNEASSTLVDAADELSSAAASLGQTREDVLQDVDDVLQSTL